MEPAEVRVCQPAEAGVLRELDALCFPAADGTRERAAPMELERGLAEARVSVIEENTELVAFLQWEIYGEDHLYLAALGVRPDRQGRGLGGQLLDEFLAKTAGIAGRSMTTVTSPRNVAMLRLLTGRGFVARRLVKDYFGPGKHRLYCQLKSREEYVDPDDQYVVPAGAAGAIEDLLVGGDYAVTDVVEGAAGPMLEISRFEREDPSALQAAEMSSGVAFSTAMLAALTFLAAFAFASPRYPKGVLALLIGAILASTVSLIIYANASGELARIRSNSFEAHMKVGNLLSEFGGVLPFLLALPLTFRQITTGTTAVVLIGAVFSIGLAAYEMCPYSLTRRYVAGDVAAPGLFGVERQLVRASFGGGAGAQAARRRFWRFLFPALATAMLPLASALTPNTDGWMWGWTSAAVAFLVLRGLLAAPERFVETSTFRGPGLRVRR